MPKFNPVKEDTGTLASQRIVWTTESILIARDAVNKGKRLIANPFHENDTKKLRANLVFQRTAKEIEEWKKCRDDIIYFSNNYCSLMTPEGIQRIQLRDYQEHYLRHLQKNRLSIMLSCRQAGKTTTSGIELLHFLIFNVDKYAAVLGNKGRTAREILTKTKNIYLELPYFLKPGVEKWNEGEVLFDNGCRCVADATTTSPSLGDTNQYVLLDEFAHVPPNIAETFYNQIFPTITAAKAKLRITSTQNGHNLFYRLYKSAAEGENEYEPFKVDWPEVPEWNEETRKWEKRTEAWRVQQIANLGGEEEFNKQFGTNFTTLQNCLIPQKRLYDLNERSQVFTSVDMPGTVLSDSWFWVPGFDIHSLKERNIIVTCDLAEQLGKDYTIFCVWELKENEHFECLGFFRDNTNTRELCALSFVQFQTLLCNQERLLVSNERNTYGDIWLKDIKEQAEKAGLITWDNGCLVRYYNENGTKWWNGIKITHSNKLSHCLLIKEELEVGRIVNMSNLFLLELENFCEQKPGVFKASIGHDDLVMCAVQLTFVKETIQYKMMRNEVGVNSDTVYNIYDSLGARTISTMRSEYFQHISNPNGEYINRLVGNG